MSARLHRTQILLEQEQYRALTALAQQEKRSLSDLVRAMVQAQLEQIEHDRTERQEHQLAVLERIRIHRQAIAAKGISFPDPAATIHQVREERDADLVDRILGS